MDSRTILADLTVLELASVLAGPATGQFFAELGARVIKVENPKLGGDVTRSWRLKDENTNGTVSAYFSSVNWGKQSVAIDITTSEGKELINRLAAKADIVIASYKPGDAEKLGVDYPTFAEINPSIIYGSITGYGKGDSRAGYDAVIQAESGFMSMNGERGGDPLKMPVALMDILAAHQLKEAILLALIHRMKTGKGTEVSVSLIDAAVSSLANQGTNFLQGGQIPKPKGSLHPNIAPYGESFVCSDGRRVLLAIGNDKQFRQLCDILDESDDSPMFLTNVGRVRNRTELTEFLTPAFASKSSKYVMEKCAEHRIPVGLICTVDQAITSSLLPLFSENNLKGVPTFVATDTFKNLSAPPEMGAQSHEVLTAELGLTATELQRLGGRQVILQR